MIDTDEEMSEYGKSGLGCLPSWRGRIGNNIGKGGGKGGILGLTPEGTALAERSLTPSARHKALPSVLRFNFQSVNFKFL